jgi:hypothetical protein
MQPRNIVLEQVEDRAEVKTQIADVSAADLLC